MNVLLRIVIILVLLQICCKPIAKVVNEDAGKSEFSVKLELEKELDNVFESMVENGFTGGIAIAERNEIIYSNYHGAINLNDSVRINENSVFELASVSKQFTAAGIALLEQEGKLDIHDPVSKYLVNLKGYESITISHLVHHTSGLSDYTAEEWNFVGSAFITNDSIVNYLAREKPKLEFTPGDQYDYNNTGYVLLASVIESVSGMSFGDFLKTKIFTPAAMSNSRVYRSRYKPEKIDNYAIGFVYSDSLSKNVIPDELIEYNYVVRLDGIQGDGMVNSTIIDLLNWDRFLYSDKIFDRTTKKKLYEPTKLNNGEMNTYCYGWEVEQDSIMGKIATHGGAWPGYITYIDRHLSTEKVIVVLQNNFNNIKIPIINIRRLLYGIPLDPPKKQIPIDIETLKEIAGDYQFSDDQTVMHMKLSEDKLKVDYEGQVFYIVPYEEMKFFIEDMTDVEITFNVDDSGAISTAQYIQGEYTGTLIKLEK